MHITPHRRAAILKQTPVVVWLTGLSGSGKSTIADQLDTRLHGMGLSTTVLDGDNVRRGLNADLSFSDADRKENVRRVAHVADLMAQAGLIVIVSLISPFRADREDAKSIIGMDRFLEVFVDSSFETCVARDPKGFYARAQAGSMHLFTGVSSIYEPPQRPDVHLRMDQLDVSSAVNVVMNALEHWNLRLASNAVNASSSA